MGLFARSQDPGEAIQSGIVWRKTEAHEIVGPVEAATPDMLSGEGRVARSCFGVSRQPKQRGAAGSRPFGFGKNCVEPFRLALQVLAGAVGPPIVQQRGATDRKRGSGAWPWSERGFDRLSGFRRGNCETEAKAREAEELSKRPENDDRQVTAQRNSTDPRIGIGEGLIDHQPAIAFAHFARNALECGPVDDAAIGIVGIDNYDMMRCVRKNSGVIKGCDGVPGISPSQRVFAVGRTRNSNRAGHRKPRQPLDQRLRAGRDSDADSVGDAVSDTRGIDQRGFISMRRQPLPGFVRQLRNRPWPRIDAGREVEPRLRHSAVMHDCLGQVAAMLHGRFMPLSSRVRERPGSSFATFVLAFTFGIAAPAQAADLPRIASINLCTDQLLMKLADPAQILGLSPYSRDKVRSWAATEAKNYRRLSGEAEDVLILKPDVVVAGRYTKRATRELLKRQGQRVVEFDIAKSIDDVKGQIRKMGAIVQHPDRAEAEVARLDAAIARAKQAVSRKPYRVLAVSRRGWVSGDDSVTSALLSITGLSNAASGLAGIRHGGFAKLETIVALRPDFILVSDGSNVAQDEGRALLLHPALEELYPPSRRIVISEDLTVCGGPMLPDALDRLVAELKRVGG